MKKNTLLIVDDCLIHQHTTKVMLERKGYQVELLDDGMDALVRIKSDIDHICAILLDVYMPMVDGISTLGQLRNKHPEIPVIVISSTEDENIIKSVKALGIESFIQKPMTPEKIEQIISLIESKRK